MSLRQISPWLSAVMTTANAVPTVSAATSFVVPSNRSVHGDLHVVAKNTGTNVMVSATGYIRAQNVGGVLTLYAYQPLLLIGGDASLAGAGIDVTSAGTTIQPIVTGLVATNVEWFIDVLYRVS